MYREHDPDRDERILNEVIVDCYDQGEEMVGWYYYMTDKLRFPIAAKMRVALPGGKTEAKPVQIIGVDPKAEQGKPIRLGIAEGDSERVQHISPEDIVSIATTLENAQVINDWLYWHNHPLL